MRKVAVIGPSGSGKSTVGPALAAKLSLPYVELDSIVHGANWREATSEELRAKLEPVLAGNRWVIDGNYTRMLGDLVVSQADVVVFLDLPLRTLLRRLWRRTWHRIRHDVELWNGNREDWRSAVFSRDSLFLWMLKSRPRMRRSIPERMARYPHVRLLRFRTQAEIDRFLAGQ